MNSEQVQGLIRGVLMMASGAALKYGISSENWVSVVGLLAAIGGGVWSWYSNRTASMVDAVAKQPEVLSIIGTPNLVSNTHNMKVRA